MSEAAPSLAVRYRLPVDGWPEAVFESNYSFQGGQLRLGGEVVLRAADQHELERGVQRALRPGGETIRMQLVEARGSPYVEINVGGRHAPRTEDLSAPTSRSAWNHAWIALCGSGAGFVASLLYLFKAWDLESAWALKMAYHMAGWHLLLTLTLFPASVWGQRIGIRSVQFVSFVFFAIHASIAIANLGADDPTNPDDPWIATLNAVSGVLFLVATIYGNRAHRDMDPVAALQREPLSR